MSLDFDSLGLIGRQHETEQLTLSLSRVVSNNAVELVWIQAEAGVGKSALAQQLLVSRCDAVLFGQGKFEESSEEPFQAIIQCFSSLTLRLLEDKRQANLWKARLHDTLTAAQLRELAMHSQAFQALLASHSHLNTGARHPSRRGLDASEDSRAGNHTANKRSDFLRIALQSLCRCLCQEQDNGAVVLLLDDLQWSDATSIKILNGLLSDPRAQNLMLVATSRPLATNASTNEDTIQALTGSSVPYIKLDLTPLNVEHVNEVLVQLTCRTPNDCAELAQLIHSRTGGNAMFVKQFLQMLAEKQILTYNDGWTWDMASVQANTKAMVELIQVLAQKVRALPIDVQHALTHAACLGQSTFGVDILQRVMPDQAIPQSVPSSTANLEQALEVAVEAGLIERYSGQGRYRFTHDRVRESIRDRLLPTGQQLKRIHRQIGKVLLNMAEEYQSDEKLEKRASKLFLLGVHHLNLGHGEGPVDESDQPSMSGAALARLNFKAAETARNQALFYTATKFCESALKCLPRSEKWGLYYDMTLKVTVAHSRILCFMGKVVESEAMARMVLTHCRTLVDQLDLYNVLVDCLVTQLRIPAAMECLSEVLGKLGVEIPSRSTIKFSNIRRILSNQIALRRRGIDRILALAPIKDPLMERRFEFLEQLLEVASLLGDQDVAAFAFTMPTFQMLRHGAPDSLHVEVMVLACQCSIVGKFDDAHKLAEIAKSMIDESTPVSKTFRVKNLDFYLVVHRRKPLTHCLEEASRFKEFLLENGIIKEFFYTSLFYNLFYYTSGLRLMPLEKDMNKLQEMLIDFGYHICLTLNEPLLQYVQCLMGMTANPTIMTGSTMDQETALLAAANTNNTRVFEMIWTFQLFLGVFFNDYDLAVTMGSQMGTLEETPGGLIRERIAFQGLSWLAKAHETGQSKYWKKARPKIRCLEKLTAGGCPNTYHYVVLLRAEEVAFWHRKSSSSSSCHLSAVQKAYDDAISVAARLGIRHIQALGNERAGLFFLHHDDKVWASTYLTRAWSLYQEWGALGKSRHMETCYGDLVAPDESRYVGTDFRSRERLDLERYVSSVRDGSFELDGI